MDTLVEKFDPFELFTNLIPGIILTTLFSASLYLVYGNIWTGLGGEKYFAFFVVCYLTGLMFKELSSLCNPLFLWKLLYGGKPREIFLMEQGHEKIFETEAEYLEAKKAEAFVISRLGIPREKQDNGKKFRTYSNMIFAYCLNILEANGLSKKGSKMQLTAEMSTSLSLGCFLVLVMNGFLMCRDNAHLTFYIIESLVLLAVALILLSRKKRFEKYHVQIIVRYFNLHINGLAASQQ